MGPHQNWRQHLSTALWWLIAVREQIPLKDNAALPTSLYNGLKLNNHPILCSGEFIHPLDTPPKPYFNFYQSFIKSDQYLWKLTLNLPSAATFCLPVWNLASGCSVPLLSCCVTCINNCPLLNTAVLEVHCCYLYSYFCLSALGSVVLLEIRDPS